MPPGTGEQPSVFRVGGISYLRIPAPDTQRAGAFYERAFGWHLRGDPAHPSFDDAKGHVIGHSMPDLPVAGWVATFRDPAGNVLGVWQQGPRA